MTKTGTGGGSVFYGYDGNGNVTTLVDAESTSVVAVYEYGPFGEVIRKSGPFAVANPFTFSTKYEDDVTGHLYYGFRYYSPQLGRWLSRDPIGELGGPNLNGFLSNEPLSRVDEHGLVACCFEGRALDIDCSALRNSIHHLDQLARDGIKQLADVGGYFDDAQISALLSLGISATFAVSTVSGLAKGLAINAARNTPAVVTDVARGTTPVGLFTKAGRVTVPGSPEFATTIARAESARNAGAASLFGKSAGEELGQEVAEDISKTIQRVLDPYGRLSDVQNELGSVASRSVYETIRELQGRRRRLQDVFDHCCAK